MKRTIMVMDDKKDMRNGFKEILELEGYKVITASSGKDCFEKLKKEKPDLVLLDVLMPKMSGVKTLEKVRETYPSIKVIIVTVVGEEETKEKTAKFGVEGYLVKPVSQRDLIRVVTDVLSEV